jgi:hypothetical protein
MTRLISLVLLLFVCAALPAPQAHADSKSPAIVELNDGSFIQDYAWWDEDELLLYTVNSYGAILWKHQITSGDRKKLISATDLEELLHISGGWDKLELNLSPQRGYISFYAPPAGPAQPPLFRVVDMTAGKMRAINFTKIPADFVVGHHVWDNTDKYVYVSAEEYTSPDSSISLGRLSLETGAFLPLAVKDQVDLIDELEYDSQGNNIIIAARSYNGEYPRGQFLLRYSLNDNTLSKIGDAYEYRGIQVSDTGEITAATVAKEAFAGSSFPGFLMVDDSFRLPDTPAEGKNARLVSRILLIPPGGEPEVLLTSQDRGFDFDPRLSPNGSFLAFKRMYYRLPYAVEVALPQNGVFLCLRERKGPQEYLVMQNVVDYRFSPGSQYIAARPENKARLEIYELPRG